MSNLQHMIVIPPSLYEKWHQSLVDSQKLSKLDKKMNRILNQKNLSESKKWYLYRQQLMLFADYNRRMKVTGESPSLQQHQKLEDKEYQGNNTSSDFRISKLRDSIGLKRRRSLGRHVLFPHKTSFEENTKFVNVDESNNDIADFRDNEEIFSSTIQNDNSGENESISRDLTEDDISSEYDMEEEFAERALEGKPKDVKIVSVRKSLLPNDYRIYRLTDNEEVTVPGEALNPRPSTSTQYSGISYRILRNRPVSRNTSHVTKRRKKRAAVQEGASSINWDSL